MVRLRSSLVSLACGVVLLQAAPLVAQVPVVSKQADVSPAEIADPVEAVLASGGPRVAVGPVTLDFWWVKSMPLRAASTESSWAAVEDGTIVGAVRLSADFKEIRGKTVKAGVYLLRYALQPGDGNHLGVSAFREFLLLTPIAGDTTASVISADDAMKLAKQTTPGHPAAWSLDPPVATGTPLTSYQADGGLAGVIFEVPISRDGKDMGSLRFGLILVGTVTT